MMSRRKFLKYMVLSFGLLSGGLLWIIEMVTGKKISLKDLKLTPDDPASVEAATPEETPAPEPSPVSTEPLLSFFLLSDLHISVGESIMTDKLKWALDDITDFESKVDTIVLGGDLTDFGRESDYKLLKKTLDGYTLPPLYGNMGNHDYYDIWLDKDGSFSTETMPNGKTDSLARERFQNFFQYDHGKAYNDVWVGGVHLIMVSQECYVEERSDVGEGAWYSDDQLAWLKQTMEKHREGSPAFVFIHQPLPSPGSDGRTHQLIRAKEFRAILEPYKNVFVLSGHTHMDFRASSHYTTTNTFHWFNNSSVGRCRGSSNSTNSAQGMYIQVYGNKVHVRGREFSDKSWIEGSSWEVPLVSIRKG